MDDFSRVRSGIFGIGYPFEIGAREFVNNWNAQGPAHHCAVGVGHIGGKLHKLAALLEIEIVQVC